MSAVSTIISRLTLKNGQISSYIFFNFIFHVDATHRPLKILCILHFKNLATDLYGSTYPDSREIFMRESSFASYPTYKYTRRDDCRLKIINEMAHSLFTKAKIEILVEPFPGGTHGVMGSVVEKRHNIYNKFLKILLQYMIYTGKFNNFSGLSSFVTRNSLSFNLMEKHEFNIKVREVFYALKSSFFQFNMFLPSFALHKIIANGEGLLYIFSSFITQNHLLLIYIIF